MIVLGAGPAGLGAALALTRAGARVAVVDLGGEPGGISRTIARDGCAFDLGGHILFVHDGAREAWLRELLGPDLVWVDRPVACVRDGRVVKGRYLDQREQGLGAPPHAVDGGPSAADLLGQAFGSELVDAAMRRYLEKVDGIPLERITAARARKLLVEQYAPTGFWFAEGGVGRLMDAMARAIVAGGGAVHLRSAIESINTNDGRVESVSVYGLDGRPLTLSAPRVIAGITPAVAAGLVLPAPPAEALEPLPARAAAIVALTVAQPAVTDEAWIQVDRPDVPFARLAEMRNWSARMAPDDRTVLVCEVYCRPTADDPWWQLDDDALSRVCAAALIEPLHLVDPGATITPLQVVRLTRAWSLVDVDAVDRAAQPARWLSQIDGFIGAQGGDVISAIAAGEHAAALAGQPQR